MATSHWLLIKLISLCPHVFQSEYIAPCDCRREYICGFNGSAGKWKSQTRSQDIISTVGGVNHLHPDTPTRFDVSRGVQFQNRLPTFVKVKIQTESWMIFRHCCKSLAATYFSERAEELVTQSLVI